MISRANLYLFSSFLNVFISLFFTLFLIMSIVFFIQISRITSYIEINFIELLKLYSFMLPQILLFTVPIAYFVSVAMSMFRLSKENESIVLFALGQDPKSISKFFICISAIISFLLLLNSLILIPIAQNLNENFIEYKKTKLSLNIKPSEFGQKFGDWMVFMEDYGKDDMSYETVVMYSQNNKKESFIIAKNGEIDTNNSAFELVLKDGKTYDIDTQKWQISDYDTMIIRTFLKNEQNKNYSLISYWEKGFSDDGRARDFSIYVLVSLFPLVCILFAISFGMITYRYEKGGLYVGIFTVLFAYFALISLLAKHPLYAIPCIFIPFFLLSKFVFYKKILLKY